MPNFTGTLYPNEVISAIYNMIISQSIFANNIASTNSELVNMNRVDGGMYGDTKLYYATDVLKSAPWLNDAEAQNLLAIHRPPAPSVQAIRIDTFRQISLTIDDYMSKRAFSSETIFSEFNSVLVSWIRETRRIYDATMFNAYVGTASTDIGRQMQNVILPTDTDKEAENRLQAQTIAEFIANLLVDLKDMTRDFNDYQYLRSYDVESDIIIVWNSKYLNKIKKLDLPTMFHNEKLIDKFGEFVLPERFFGSVNEEAGTAPDPNTTVRSLNETDYKVGEKVTHVFAGDLIPAGSAYESNTTYTNGTTSDIVCKIMYKRSIPLMSGFSVATSFFNPKSLTDNRYLTWSHNTLEYLKNYPMITVTATQATTQNTKVAARAK